MAKEGSCKGDVALMSRHDQRRRTVVVGSIATCYRSRRRRQPSDRRARSRVAWFVRPCGWGGPFLDNREYRLWLQGNGTVCESSRGPVATSAQRAQRLEICRCWGKCLIYIVLRRPWPSSNQNPHGEHRGEDAQSAFIPRLDDLVMQFRRELFEGVHPAQLPEGLSLFRNIEGFWRARSREKMVMASRSSSGISEGEVRIRVMSPREAVVNRGVTSNTLVWGRVREGGMRRLLPALFLVTLLWFARRKIKLLPFLFSSSS